MIMITAQADCIYIKFTRMLFLNNVPQHVIDLGREGQRSRIGTIKSQNLELACV